MRIICFIIAIVIFISTGLIQFKRPAVQANINAQEYRSMPIPLPPIVKQKEIANHIYAMRQQAKQLQEEGESILENAKKKLNK